MKRIINRAIKKFEIGTLIYYSFNIRKFQVRTGNVSLKTLLMSNLRKRLTLRTNRTSIRSGLATQRGSQPAQVG